jgi:tetratricopeptide (TPR) repeat protein
MRISRHNISTILGICLGLAAIVWFVFGQTLRHGFVNYDDETYVYENPKIISGLTRAGIFWAFTHAHVGNWHPLTSISHMLDCQVYGLNPGGHHFTNVLLHTLAVVLLFLLLQQITGALWRSAFVAAVFAIHPLRVESVAWISERKDVLSGLFFMLTLVAYTRYVSGARSLLKYLLVAFLFALGLMAKSMLVTLPCVLLLLDYWPLRRFGHYSLGNDATFARRSTFPQLLAEKIPLFFLSSVVSIATWWTQRAAMRSTVELPLVVQVGNAIISYARYLWQLLWPTDLAPFYPYPHAIPLPRVLAAALLLGAISAAVVRFRRKLPYLITGWGWYLIMLLPVIGLVQVGSQARADRYTYLPQIGIVLALTWTIAEATAGIRQLRRVIAFGAVAITVALAGRAYHQTRYWRKNESLWLHTLAVTQNNDAAHNSLGDVWLNDGRVDDAMREFQAALKITPDFFIARNNLGLAYLQKGELADAITEFRRALSRDPQNVKCRFNLAAAFLTSGRAAEAISEYQKALAIQPDSAQGHSDLGNAYMRAGRLADAIAQFKIALLLRPRYADAEYNLGIAEIQNGNRAEAIRRFQNTLALAPDNAGAHNNLAVALLLEGRPDDAIAHLERCLALQPANVDAHNNLAFALAGKQQWNAAIGHWRKALEIDPENLAAQSSLAWTLATAPDSAVRNGAEALTISQHLSQSTNALNPMLFRVLGAAYAETGQFPKAIETARRAIDLATAQNRTELAASLQGDLKLFQSRQPLRDTSQPSHNQ